MTLLHPIESRLMLVPKRLTVCLVAVGVLSALPSWADTAPQTLPFSQNWGDTSLIGTDGDWSRVPGIVGYLGDISAANPAISGVDARTLTGWDAVNSLNNFGAVNVNANQTAPNTFNTGGVSEFQLANATIALNGSGTADAPSIVIHLNTTNQKDITVSYLLRDLDGSIDNATQQVALQYRVGSTGNFINVSAGYVADATSGPSLATLSTAVNVTLPADAANQPVLQVRIITTNAGGNDEWVGIDDISITGTDIGGDPVNLPIVATCPASSIFAQGAGGSISLSATDADSVVNGANLISVPTGITLGALNAASSDGGVASVGLNVASTVATGSYAVQVGFTNNELQSADCSVTVRVDGLTTIPQIQGSAARSSLVGQRVTTRGVVTLRTNNGFFMQDPAGDGNLDTSDGIFIFTSSTPPAAAAVGNEVSVAGLVAEFAVGTAAESVDRPITQLTRVSAAEPLVVSLLSTGNSVAPTPVFLPESTEGEIERLEGMLVRIEVPLTASQNFFQGRFGQVTLSANGRLIKPTNIHPAGSPDALNLADENARRRIILDDGSSLQNPNPTPYFAADNTLRAGDTLAAGLTGVIDYGLAASGNTGISDYKIHPTLPVVFSRTNPRTAAPAAVGGDLRVGSFNVLNYFTTVGPLGTPCFGGECRGANSDAEFQRQRNKIIPAILGLNADVVGLMEIENNGQTAVQDLVNGLNAKAGAGTWATIPLPEGGTGTDAIRVAMIYKPARVSLVGGAISDTDAVHNRPPLAQTFAAANGGKFSVVVNHFKSKGSCPSSASDVDADLGDGQGCWNVVRTEQAQALNNFITTKLNPVDPDVLVVGDLNAYGKEDPILELASQGFVDLIARFNPVNGYSYVFDGESGYLDHALASASLSAQIAGANHWNINADEPSIIDYNTDFKVGDSRCGTVSVPTCSPDYYSATVYRSSDHDSVVVGLSLAAPVVPGLVINGTAGRDTLVGTAGNDRITGGLSADVITGGAGADTIVYTSMRDAGDRITDFVPGTDRIELNAVLAAIGYTGSNAFSDGFVKLVNTAAGLSLQIDTDGNAGPAVGRPLTTLTGVTAAQIIPGRDLGL